MIGGALVDDVDYYNRVHEMMYILSTKHNHDSDDVESFGYRWGGKDSYAHQNLAHIAGTPQLSRLLARALSLY